MRNRTLAVGILIGLAAATVAAQSSSKAAHAGHVAVTPGEIAWGPAPPALPAGAQVAVLDGDPFKPGFFSIRLKMPDGYRIAPHWHPTDEHVTVLQGSLKVGAGDTYDDGAMRTLAASGFAKLPKAMHHYAGAKGDTIVQIYGDGPFVVNYLNPADDPRRKPTR